MTTTTHVISCDTTPSTQCGWTIEEHRKSGQMDWSHEKISLHLVEIQKTGHVDGYVIRKEFADKPVLNACVLDHLLANQHLIPSEWNDKAIFFWGTIYRDPEDNLCVRYLRVYGCPWGGSRRLSSGDWSDSLAAVLKPGDN